MKIQKLSTLVPVAAASVIGFAASAQAQNANGFFIEPGVTYQLGNSTADFPSPFNSSTGKIQGFGGVARAGLHLNESFFLAVDGRYSRPNFTNSANNYDAAAEAYQAGPVVGVQMPDLGLRLWAGYIATGELNPAESNGFDVKLSDGQGYHVGAGFRVSSVSFNLEYQNMRYGKTNLEKAGPLSTDASTDSVKLDDKAVIGSVTFPIEF